LQFQDRIDLAIAERKRCRDKSRLVNRVFRGVKLNAGQSLITHGDRLAREKLKEMFPRIGARRRSTNDLDDIVKMVERDLIAEQNVLALAGLAQEEGGTAAHHVNAVVDEVADGVGQRQLARLAVDHGQEDHREALLHLRVLVELVEDDLRFSSALELDDDAHAVAVALVAHVGDVVDDLVLVDLVGNLADDDRLPTAGDVLGPTFGADEEAAAACFVGVLYTAGAIEDSAGGEVRTLHVPEDLAQAGMRVVHHLNGCIDHFRQVVWRDVRSHTHRDAA